MVVGWRERKQECGGEGARSPGWPWPPLDSRARRLPISCDHVSIARTSGRCVALISLSGSTRLRAGPPSPLPAALLPVFSAALSRAA